MRSTSTTTKASSLPVRQVHSAQARDRGWNYHCKFGAEPTAVRTLIARGTPDRMRSSRQDCGTP